MEKLPPIPSPPGTAWREFRINVVPVAAFVAVLGATIFTWRHYVGPSPLVGEVEAIRTIIASPQAGRVIQLQAGHLEHVSPGQPLVQLLTTDPKVLEANIAVSRARIELARINVDPTLRRENNLISYTRLRLDWLQRRAELAETRVRLGYYESALDRVQRFYNDFTNRFTSPLDLDIAKRDVEVAKATMAAQVRLVSDIEESMKSVEPDEGKLDTEVSASVRATIAVEEAQLRLIEAQLAPVTLTADREGVVSIVHRHAGESVLAGDPILTISSISSDRIVGFIRQPLRIEPRKGMELDVRPRSFDRKAGRGRIISVGTQMEPILPELLPNSAGRVGERGLPIIVTLPLGMKLIPGEFVDLLPVGR
jgi:multidrug resistance efflux pump